MIDKLFSIITPFSIVAILTSIVSLLLLFGIDLYLQWSRQYRDTKWYRLLTDLSLFWIPTYRHYSLAFFIPFVFILSVGVIINIDSIVDTVQKGLKSDFSIVSSTPVIIGVRDLTHTSVPISTNDLDFLITAIHTITPAAQSTFTPTVTPLPSPTNTASPTISPTSTYTPTPITPTATSSVTPTPSWHMYVINVTSLRLRKCPSLDCEVLGGIKQGVGLLTDGTTQKADGIIWYQVVNPESTNEKAWISGNYLAEYPPEGYPTATKYSVIPTTPSLESVEIVVTVSPPKKITPIVSTPTRAQNTQVSNIPEENKSGSISGLYWGLGIGFIILLIIGWIRRKR